MPPYEHAYYRTPVRRCQGRSEQRSANSITTQLTAGKQRRKIPPGMPYRLLAALTVPLVAAVLLSLACGSPAPGHKTFVFTPVPYTVTPEYRDCTICGEAVSVDESGGRYYSDQVVLQIDPAAEGRITELIDKYGFEIERRTHDDGDVNLLVRVPPGSARAAASLFRTQQGVQHAGLNVLLNLG